jgi:uncharacterized protein YbcI
MEGSRPPLEASIQQTRGSRSVSLHADSSVKTNELVIVFTMPKTWRSDSVWTDEKAPRLRMNTEE